MTRFGNFICTETFATELLYVNISFSIRYLFYLQNYLLIRNSHNYTLKLASILFLCTMSELFLCTMSELFIIIYNVSFSNLILTAAIPL